MWVWIVQGVPCLSPEFSWDWLAPSFSAISLPHLLYVTEWSVKCTKCVVFVTSVTELERHCFLALFFSVMHFSIIGQIDENSSCNARPLKFHLTKRPKRKKKLSWTHSIFGVLSFFQIFLQLQCILWATQAAPGHGNCSTETMLYRGPKHPSLVHRSFPHAETCTSKKTKISYFIII